MARLSSDPSSQGLDVAYAPKTGARRFFVGVDVPSPKGEMLLVLTPYFTSCARAERAREEILSKFPQCQVHSNFLRWSDDPAHEPKMIEYLKLARQEIEHIQ